MKATVGSQPSTCFDGSSSFERSSRLFFGWRGGGMASLYTREANRAKLARATAAMLLPERDENIYSLTFGSGEGARRDKVQKPTT
jgi:hypothetical protein